VYCRWPVVYVAIMADDDLPSEELEYSDNVVVELDDICVASEEYFVDADGLDCSLLGAIAMHYAHLGLGLGLYMAKFNVMAMVRVRVRVRVSI